MAKYSNSNLYTCIFARPNVSVTGPERSSSRLLPSFLTKTFGLDSTKNLQASASSSHLIESGTHTHSNYCPYLDHAASGLGNLISKAKLFESEVFHIPYLWLLKDK
ncbi:hypothetical protein VNO77_26694 [Canavalia gladiata]|uniref:Uncharacterized protein n=1 Tax=Canavalia gladiata TaxID=3824 RepID=A0AAN9KWH2_CANGL